MFWYKKGYTFLNDDIVSGVLELFNLSSKKAQVQWVGKEFNRVDFDKVISETELIISNHIKSELPKVIKQERNKVYTSVIFIDGLEAILRANLLEAYYYSLTDKVT